MVSFIAALSFLSLTIADRETGRAFAQLGLLAQPIAWPAISARVNPRLSVKLRSATMTQRIADDFPSIAASLKKLERDKEAALNRPAQTNERLIPRVAEEARERAKKLPPGSERDALPSVRHSDAARR
jgi:hypothetical protein